MRDILKGFYKLCVCGFAVFMKPVALPPFSRSLFLTAEAMTVVIIDRESQNLSFPPPHPSTLCPQDTLYFPQQQKVVADQHAWVRMESPGRVRAK